MAKTKFRGWEYAKEGDYHKNLDPDWSYTPTYLKKMYHIRGFFDSLPKGTKILDAGCGEGVLVEEYLAKGYTIQGIDLNYESKIVMRGDILNMPFKDKSFDVVLLLDVFEHLAFSDQPKALKEIQRVLSVGGGYLLASIPNLAHLNSRIMFFMRGNFQRTDCEENHPGERPIRENIKLLREGGFGIEKIIGITLTVPIIYNCVICRKPSWFLWLHNFLDYFAIPSMAMLNLFVCKKKKGEEGQ